MAAVLFGLLLKKVLLITQSEFSINALRYRCASNQKLDRFLSGIAK
ncbi:MAG: hypothetical protein AB8B55_02820 [Mariniblastus sp.]